MKSAVFRALLLLTLSAISAHAQQRCGAEFGTALCDGGLCCSKWGFCGATPDHCGAGCQSNCGGGPAPTSEPTDRCGAEFGNATCANGLCCSKYGNCGQFEKTSSQFMLLHLKPSELAVVRKIFPNLGNLDSLDGTLTAAVLGNADSTNTWQGILLIAGAIAIVVLGLSAS